MKIADFNAAQQAEADARHREVVEAWREGKTLVEIAAETGRTVGRIHQIITRARVRGLLHDPERQRPRKSA
jgi:transposase